MEITTICRSYVEEDFFEVASCSGFVVLSMNSTRVNIFKEIRILRSLGDFDSRLEINSTFFLLELN